MKEDDKKEKRKDDIVKFIDYYDKMLNSLPSENIEQCNQYFNALMAESKKDNLLDALMAQSDKTLNMIYINFGYNVGA